MRLLISGSQVEPWCTPTKQDQALMAIASQNGLFNLTFGTSNCAKDLVHFARPRGLDLRITLTARLCARLDWNKKADLQAPGFFVRELQPGFQDGGKLIGDGKTEAGASRLAVS